LVNVLQLDGDSKVLTVNAQYNVARPDSLPIKVAGHQRRKMFAAFMSASGIVPDDTVVDVGVTSDRSYDHSNYFEAWYPHKSRITAVGLDDASFLEQEYAGVRFLRADGRDLPFESGSFAFAHSSAVLEHAGSRDMQVRFLREIWRVAHKGIFVTTPNRWFPIEVHSLLPFLHWLPAPLFRKALIGLHREFFAAEENLNLLSPGSLAEAARAAGIERFRITSVGMLGWPSNLLLIAGKN
jgi:SAM-dependent methyltransferase